MVEDTAPIRVEERFDETAVARYLQSELPSLVADGQVSFDQFPGGAANLTYRAVTADGTELVLRRAPLGRVAEGSHDMAREYRVLSRLWREYPLAPRAYAYCDDATVMGKPFFVMERREGYVVRDRWPDVFAGDEARMRTAGVSLVAALADLHDVDPDAVGLGELGRPRGFVERQIAGWSRRWSAAATRPVPDMDAVGEALAAGIPEPQRAVILHNDYKLDNAMIDRSGRVVAIFDWDMATLGDPLVDVGTMLAYWAQPDDPTYAVFGANAVAIGAHVDKSEVTAIYAEHSGLDLAEIDFYEALALFRIAVIVEQIYARYVAGQTTDERFASFEPLAPLLAASARRLIGR
ncbi:MAG: phosphotransferase family protein [Acidimicrobiia bacterium]|nr:phosphotransferase family protein [Acidimicrobiia bacterium]